MTNQQILEKAIRLAIDGGWSMAGFNAKDDYSAYPDPTSLKAIVFPIQTAPTTNDIIFNHYFAKALWGDTELCFECSVMRMEKPYPVNPEYGCDNEDYYEHHKTGQAWAYHLQQMVIADDPIKYLGENI